MPANLVYSVSDAGLVLQMCVLIAELFLQISATVPCGTQWSGHSVLAVPWGLPPRRV